MAGTGAGAAGPEGATTGCGLPDDQPGCGPVVGGCGPVAGGCGPVAGRAPRGAGWGCTGCGCAWVGMAGPGSAGLPIGGRPWISCRATSLAVLISMVRSRLP